MANYIATINDNGMQRTIHTDCLQSIRSFLDQFPAASLQLKSNGKCTPTNWEELTAPKEEPKKTRRRRRK